MKKWKRWGVNLLVNIPIMLLSLTCIFPVVWLLYSSLKTDVEFARSTISLPAVPDTPAPHQPDAADLIYP